MDTSKLQMEVFEKVGIRLDRTDPVFALVALNEVVIGELLASAQEQWVQNNSELDAKIGGLVKIHDQILIATRELVGRADQAHLAAALKAAAEAKEEIFRAARDAVSAEIEKSVDTLTRSADRIEETGRASRIDSWLIAIVQAVVGGMVAAVVVLGGMAMV